MKFKRTKATNIPQKVKERVWTRNNSCCVICDNNYNTILTHIILDVHMMF